MNQVTYNLLSKILDPNLKVLYSKSDTIFDSIMNKVDGYLIYRDSFFSDRVSYDLFLGNDTMTHCDDKNKIIRHHQINDVLFIHDKFHRSMKKEDKTIIKNNLQSTFKIFPNKEIASTWDCLSDTIIPYGIPQSEYNLSNKRKSVAVINIKNNPQIEMLYNQIKAVYNDAELVGRLSTFEEYTGKLNEFKIVIEIDSLANLLVAQCCGNYTVTTVSNMDSGLGIYDVSDWSKIKEQIDQKLENYDPSMFLEQKRFLEEQYSFEKFESSVLEILLSIKKRPYLI
jgi:hypothetical protein